MMPFVLAYPKGYSPSPGISEALVGAFTEMLRYSRLRSPGASAPGSYDEPLGVLIPTVSMIKQKAPSFDDAFCFGVPEGIRTPDRRLRRPLLYPTELRAQNGAGEGNRTLTISLEG